MNLSLLKQVFSRLLLMVIGCVDVHHQCVNVWFVTMKHFGLLNVSAVYNLLFSSSFRHWQKFIEISQAVLLQAIPPPPPPKALTENCSNTFSCWDDCSRDESSWHGLRRQPIWQHPDLHSNLETLNTDSNPLTNASSASSRRLSAPLQLRRLLSGIRWSLWDTEKRSFI